jgi:hypothetical protein
MTLQRGIVIGQDLRMLPADYLLDVPWGFLKVVRVASGIDEAHFRHAGNVGD